MNQQLAREVDEGQVGAVYRSLFPGEYSAPMTALWRDGALLTEGAEVAQGAFDLMDKLSISTEWNAPLSGVVSEAGDSIEAFTAGPFAGVPRMPAELVECVNSRALFPVWDELEECLGPVSELEVLRQVRRGERARLRGSRE